MNQTPRMFVSSGEALLSPSPLTDGRRGSAVPALVLDRIRQVYGHVEAVDEVSFSLAHGEILALVGHSGSGKSTVLRVAAGLERPVSGRVVIDNREVCSERRFVPAEHRGVGLMFQDYALFPHMTVLANVRFGLGKFARAEGERIARRALDNIGISALADKYPYTLSGGEQQRVALARALAPAPSFLLMDEPFSNLDRRTRDLVRDETIATLRRTNATAVLVTHDPDEAMRLADRVVLLSAGRVIQAGTVEELYRRPGSLFVARFFSEFDEVEGIVRGGRVQSALGDFPANGYGDGTKVTICIRANAIRLGESGNGVTARLVSRRFLGETDLVHVAVAGLDHLLHARLPPDIPGGEGDSIALDIAREDVMVFGEAD